MLVAAIVFVCMGGQPCNQMGGSIAKSWCGKTASLVRPASMGGNYTIRVQCTGRVAGR